MASSSAGNCCCIVSGGAALLIDCGISNREISRRLSALGIDPGSVAGVVFTHDHGDHIRGAATFRKRHPDAALFANMMTAEAISASTGIREDDFIIFENGQQFECGPFSVTPFQIPHDTPDPVGFSVECEGMNYFHATDMGFATDLAGLYFSKADVAVLESNHDPEMLWASSRSYPLKQRIAGRSGHLSNDDAAQFVSRHASARLKALALAHLSQECNAPHIALKTVKAAIASSPAAGAEVTVLDPCETTVVYDGGEA